MQPIIVMTGMNADSAPIWVQTLRDALGATYRYAYYPARDRYVSKLADDLAALVLVNGNADDWQFWTATPKSSPATRRIPVFVVSESSERRQSALLSGADMALTATDLIKDGTRLVADFARVFDPERAEQLDCECGESLPSLAVQGVEKFNAGEFYKQHDLFEELWVETDGPVRDLYRAILQVGVAYFQIQRGNHRGARKMLLRSVQWLAILPDTCQGIDVAALKADAARVRAELERLPEDQINQFDQTLLQPVKLVDTTPDEDS